MKDTNKLRTYRQCICKLYVEHFATDIWVKQDNRAMVLCVLCATLKQGGAQMCHIMKGAVFFVINNRFKMNVVF